MPANSNSKPLSALVDALARHRLLLFVLYIGFTTLCVAAVYELSFLGAPAALNYVVPGRDFDAIADWGSERSIAEAIVFVIGLLALQALFLFGGGRIPITSKPVGIWRTLVPVSIASAAGVLMLVTFAYTVLEIFDRADSEGSIRDAAILSMDSATSDGGRLLLWLSLVWLVWVVLATFASRRRDHASVIRRLTHSLIAGSWIEFLVALPVDIAIRQRAESCYCNTGSWFALLVAIPVMIFAFGPALFLLYLREIELGRAEPRRAMRILLHKSRRGGDRKEKGHE